MGVPFVPQYPHCVEHAFYLPQKPFDGAALVVPIRGLEVAVMGAGDDHVDRRWKDAPENITGAAGMVVGSHDDDIAPFFLDCQRFEGFGLFDGAIGVVRKRNDAIFWDASLDQIVSHEPGNAEIGAKAATAGDNEGREALAKEFGGARGAIGVKIIVAEKKDCIGVAERVFDDPVFSREAHQRMPGKIEKHEEEDDKEEDNESGDSSAALARAAPDHGLGSSERKYSAACSGRMALK